MKARLKEIIKVSQPDGFVEVGKGDWVYVLRKAFYGLCQSCREWDLTLHKFQVAFRFVQSKADPKLYVWTRGEAVVMIVISVDDVLMSGDSDEWLNLVVDFSKASFEVRVDSEIEKLLGISIEDIGDSVKLQRAPMNGRLLKACEMRDCQPAKSPLQQKLDLAAEESENLSHATPFRQLTGSMVHLGSTVRPDIAFAIGYLSQFMHKPTKVHWKAGELV